MSNEDEMVEEETSDDSVEEEESDDDAFAGEVEIPQGGGCSAGTWIIILLIIAALVYVGVWQFKKSAAVQAENERIERQRTREGQMGQVGADLATVETSLQQGDIAGAIEALQQMDQKLEIIQAAANSSGDSDAALAMNSQRTTIRRAAEQIEVQYDLLQQAADESISAVRGTLGSHAPAAIQPAVDEDEPGDGEEPAGDGEEAAGDGDEAAGDEPADVPADEPAGVPAGEPAGEEAALPGPGAPAGEELP